MPDYFAAFLDLRGRPCLVVGGGVIAERKALSLVDCGARVRVVAPRLTPALAVLARTGVIEHRARTFRKADVRGCALVIAATAASEADQGIADAARRRAILVNVVDRPALCDFIFPSVVRRGPLQIAVPSSAQSPALAREARKRVEALIGPEYETLTAPVGTARRHARALALTEAERLSAAESAVALAPRPPHDRPRRSARTISADDQGGRSGDDQRGRSASAIRDGRMIREGDTSGGPPAVTGPVRLKRPMNDPG